MTLDTPEKKRSVIFDQCIIKSWWVILFSLLCLFLYDGAIKNRALEESKLLKKKQTVLDLQNRAQAMQESWLAQIESQEDPEWIELVLMQRLGLVPEGAIKVLFSD